MTKSVKVSKKDLGRARQSISVISRLSDLLPTPVSISAYAVRSRVVLVAGIIPDTFLAFFPKDYPVM